MCVLDLLLIQMILKKLYRCPKDSLDFRRAIRKIMGGAGEVQKKYSRKGKLNEKKSMHAK